MSYIGKICAICDKSFPIENNVSNIFCPNCKDMLKRICDGQPEVEDYGYRDEYINIYKFKSFLCHANSDGDFVERVFSYIDDYIKEDHA